MFEQTLESVISIDTDNEIIHLYSRQGGGADMVPVIPNKNGDQQQEERRINYHVVSYKAAPYSDEFFTKFQDLIKKYREDFPTAPMQRISLILPDSACLTDTLTIPVMQKKLMENSLTAALVNLYGNVSAYKYNRFPLLQNKQHATFGISAVKREILDKFNITCATLQIGISNVTYASNAAVDGALALNPKLRNTSFVLLDIRDTTAKIIFVVKGKTVGSYRLPFGYSMLVDNMMIPEDLLFDHALGEAEVAAAKERAKAKNSAADKKRARQEAAEEDYDEEEEEEIDEEEGEERSTYMADGVERPAFLTDKEPRKLPQYMLRETPDSAAGIVFENFRLFVKWTCDVIAANTTITSLDSAMKTVYVNMPEQLNFIFDMIKAESADGDIRFEPLCETQGDEMIHRYLEFYGGFFVKHNNKVNNF